MTYADLSIKGSSFEKREGDAITFPSKVSVMKARTFTQTTITDTGTSTKGSDVAFDKKGWVTLR